MYCENTLSQLHSLVTQIESGFPTNYIPADKVSCRPRPSGVSPTVPASIIYLARIFNQLLYWQTLWRNCELRIAISRCARYGW